MKVGLLAFIIIRGVVSVIAAMVAAIMLHDNKNAMSPTPAVAITLALVCLATAVVDAAIMIGNS